MNSINDYITALRNELRNRHLPATFIDEFLENYIDQLETMKEELIDTEGLNLDEVEKSVLKRCESVTDVVNHVLELYDSRETGDTREVPGIVNQESFLVAVGILRILTITLLFPLYFIVYKSWEWGNIPGNQIIYSIAVGTYRLFNVVILLLIIFIIEALLVKKAGTYSMNDRKLNFLVDQSVFKTYYRIILVLCSVPALVPFYIYIYLDPPGWFLRIQIIVSIILAVSTIEWLLGIDKEIDFKRLYKEINPFTVFTSYVLMVLILTSFNTDNNSIAYLFVITALSLLFLIGGSGSWKKSVNEDSITLEDLGRYFVIWVPLVTILSLIFLLEEEILAGFFPAWEFYDEFIQTPYVIVFFLVVILFVIYITWMKNFYAKSWLLIGWILYAIVITSCLNFQMALHKFIMEHSFMDFETYLGYYQNHTVILVPLGIITLTILALFLFAQKQHLMDNHPAIQFYSWTFRAFLFFLLYELGAVNLFIYQLGHPFQLLVTPSVLLEWLANVFILLLFIGLEVIAEIIMVQMLNYESGIIKCFKRIF